MKQLFWLGTIFNPPVDFLDKLDYLGIRNSLVYRALTMDLHSSWFEYLPGYHALHEYLQEHFSFTVIFNSGILPAERVFETVHHIAAAALVFIILFTFSIIAKKQLDDIDNAIIPSKTFTLLTFFEIIYETLSKLMKDIIGDDYKRHLPLVGTFALFILFSNLLGLIPGFVPPTDNLNTTLACGLIVFVYFNWQGLRAQGFNHITHLANPIGYWWGWFLMPLMFPVEVLGLTVRPFSLGIRLAGNMIGDHKVLMTFVGIMPFLLPIPFFLLGLLISVIQTVVFCLLTCVYISLHTKTTEH